MSIDYFDAVWKSLTPIGFVIIALAFITAVCRISTRIIKEIGRVRAAKWTGQDPELMPHIFTGRLPRADPLPIELSGDDGLDPPTSAIPEVRSKRPRLLRDADGW